MLRFSTLLTVLACGRVLDVAAKREALTMWWVVFNNPDACITSPDQEEKCGARDVFGDDLLAALEAGAPDLSLMSVNPDAEIAIVWGAGGLSDDNGKIRLTADLYKTIDPLDLDTDVDPLQLGRGWTTDNAEVHYVLRSHDEAMDNPDEYPEQLKAFLDPFCTDAMALTASAAGNVAVCTDIQDAIFAPGFSGNVTMSSMITMQPIEGSKAYLNRRGDLLQAVIETMLEETVDDESPIVEEQAEELPPMMEANAMMEPHAYTLWWVIFNAPENCIHAPDQEEKCGPRDVFGDAYLETMEDNPDPALIDLNADAEIAMLWGAGGVSDDDGKVVFSSSMYRTTDSLQLDLNIDPMQLGRGWENPEAEVHFVVRDHGKVVTEEKGYIDQMTGLMDPFCEDPNLAYVGEEANGSVCRDIQDVLFAPGVDGEKMLHVFPGGATIEGTRVIFERRSNMLQAIVETKLQHCQYLAGGCC